MNSTDVSFKLLRLLREDTLSEWPKSAPAIKYNS